MDGEKSSSSSRRHKDDGDADHHHRSHHRHRSSKHRDREEINEDRHREKSSERDEIREDRYREKLNEREGRYREKSSERDRLEKSREREEIREDRYREKLNEREGRYREKSSERDEIRDDRYREKLNEREGRYRDKSSEREEIRGERYREKSSERNRRDREKSYEREDSVERRSKSNSRLNNKRKERGESEERGEEGRDKRARETENGKKGKRRFEDGDVKENRETRRFEDGRVKNEYDELKNEPANGNRSAAGSSANGAAVEPTSVATRGVPQISMARSHPTSSKVSSITTTNENKGNNSNRSHEVPGNSSTDGAVSDAGQSVRLSSLDVIARTKITLERAKRALQNQEVSEKLRNKISASSKGINPSRDGSPQVRSNEGVASMSAASRASSTPFLPPTSGGSVASSSLPTLSTSMNMPPSGLPNIPVLTAESCEAVKKAQELAAKLGFRQDPQFGPLINMFPGQMPPDVTIQPKPAKTPVLRLDGLGREIDEHGNVLDTTKPNNLSTLKVNINKQKKDAFQILKPELEVDPEKNPFYDPDMGINKNKILRPKRMTFQFVEEGKWAKDAEIIKMKNQFGEARSKELKVKQAQLAKAKAEPDINPNLIEVSVRVPTKEKPTKDPIPEVEWWDTPFLKTGTYDDIVDHDTTTDNMLKMDKITIYVEHPRPIEPPAEPAPPPPQPLKLTKREQKKLRTQRRLAREKERQEMIRQGLIEPPKPKVKMSNLMKVLGSEATQDPTKLEMEIRSAAAEREQAHIDRNIARKLTPSERREKKERKLFDEASTLETIVSVYKINDLSHPQTRFKVDINARENRLTGCAAISEGIAVVVVEGGNKSIKRYNKLMLRRIDWAAAVKNDEDEEQDEEKPVNKCVLVWQGSVAKASFTRFIVHDCRTEVAARKFFSDAGVAHYWELAVNFTDDQL